MPEAAGIPVMPISPAQAVYAQNVRLYLYIFARPDLCKPIQGLDLHVG